MQASIGLDIGGTRIKAVRINASGQLVTRQEVDSADDRQALQRIIQQTIESLVEEDSQSDQPMPVGLAAPGLTKPGQPMINWMSGRMESLVGLDWSQALNRPVTVLNDGHAAVLGEAWCGAAQDHAHVVLLTLGTGVGGGVMVDGRLLQGGIGRAGSLGHISLDPNGPLDIVGTPGSLEDAVGDHTVATRTQGAFQSTEALAKAVNHDDPTALGHWRTMIQYLAAGLVSLINAFDPQIIIIGGGVARAGDTLLIPLREQLRQWEWQPHGHQVQLTVAELGPWAGAIGAAHAAMQNTTQTPSKHGVSA
jgi:glucokinase